MINIDMWYGDKPSSVDNLHCFFNDCSSVYWGNVYKNGKCVGDFDSDSYADVEKAFSHLDIIWR